MAQLPEEDRPDIPGLRALEDNPEMGDPHGGSDSSGSKKGKSGGLFNASGDDAKSSDPDSLKGSEEKAGGGSLFNPKGDNGRLQKLKGRFRALAKRKVFVGFAIGGGGGGVLFIILLLFLASSLKIPNLAQHITEYEFSRVLRQSIQTTENVTEERLAIDATNDTAYSAIKAKYQGLRDDTWGKLDKYRPAKVIDNLKNDEGLKLNYGKPNLLGRTQLRGVTLGNSSFLVESQGYSRFVPGLNQAIKFKNGISFSKNFTPTLTESLKADQIGPIIRGRAAKQIRKELGINLVAWKIGEYQGKKDDAARLQQERDANKAIAEDGHESAKTPAIKDAAEAADETAKKDVADDATLRETIANNGVDKNVLKAVTDKIKPTTFDNFLKVANPVFGIALASCTIYDGSLTQSGPTVNAQTASQQRAYYYVSSAADQEKYGETDGEAVGAINAKIGDITQTNPEIRASGGTVDTSASLSSEASAGGDLSIANVVFGGTVGKLADDIAGGTCDKVLNPLLNIPLIIAGTAASIATAGGADAAGAAVDGAAEAASDSLATRLVSNISERFSGKFASKQAAKDTVGSFNAKARAIIGDTTKSALKVGSLTVMAKLIVMSKAHQMNNGLEQGPDFSNEADSGGNIAAGNIEQRQYYGRPLDQQETAEDNAQNVAFVKDQQASKPAFERYLAVSNPDSLLNHVASTTASTIHRSFFASILSLGNKLFSPLSSLNTMFGTLFTPKSFAAAGVTSSQKANYGNVQWGYSPAEMALLKNDTSYRVLENKQLLDESGEADTIQSKYGKCFDGSEKIGDMLANGDIIRNKDGDVLHDDDVTDDKAVCSPNDLSIDNDTYGDNMVFRWRVAHNYDNSLDQLGDEQTISTDDTAGGGDTSSAGTAPSVTIDLAHLNDSSVDIQCAAGTKDLGVQDGYHEGQKVPIRVCGMLDVNETGQLSTVPGADGQLVINSRLSAFYENLVKDARADGVKGISGQEGFRTMQRQIEVQPCGCAAKPGFSNHQMGTAIDWSGSMVQWLTTHGAKYGLYAKVPKEPWHWSPTGG